MLKITGAATLKVRYDVELPLSEAEFEAMTTEKAKALIAEAIKSQLHDDIQTNNLDIWDYEEGKSENASIAKGS